MARRLPRQARLTEHHPPRAMDQTKNTNESIADNGERMHILYHHRTRATDAQRVHILEIISAFRALGHSVVESSLVPAETTPDDPQRSAGEGVLQRISQRIPFANDLAQLGYNLVALPMLLRAILRRRPDFLYERCALYNFAGVLAAKIARIPIVLEVNSPFALEQNRDGQIRLAGLASWSDRVICNMADHVVVVSTPLKRILIESGVRPEKIEVMPNGVNLDEFQPSSESAALRTRLKLNERVVIGYLGWFRNWHRLDLLLEAFHLGRLAESGATLALIGDGPEMPALRAYTHQNGLDEHVLFLGALAHQDIPAHLNLFDIAVQPAANEYCCPMKLLEYMALRKAIVAPRQENVSEILEENAEACFFAPNSREDLSRALGVLVNDPAERARLGERAYAAIATRGYLWTNNAQRVAGLIAAKR